MIKTITTTTTTINFIKNYITNFTSTRFLCICRLQGILLKKLSLWSSVVIYASGSCTFAVLSEIGSYSVISLVFLFTLSSFVRFTFLQFLVIFSFNNFLYSSFPTSWIFLGLLAEKKILWPFLICSISLLSSSWKLLLIRLNYTFFIICCRLFPKSVNFWIAGGPLTDLKP